MSVVAAKVYVDKIVIGADSQSTSYWHNKDSVNKIYKIADDFVIGGVGYTAHNQLMSLFAETNKPASSRRRDVLEFLVNYNDWMKEKVEHYKPHNDFILAYKDKCYWISSEDLYIKEVEDYCAIGSGHEFAKAGLYFGKDVKEAIKVACDLTVFCSDPIEVYEVKK